MYRICSTKCWAGGGDGERRGGVTNVGFFPSQRGQHRHIQSLALSHGGTAPLLIQLQTQTRGAGSWGEFHYRESPSAQRGLSNTRQRFQTRREAKENELSGSSYGQTKRGGGKGRTHRVVAALISNHLNPGHAWSQRLGWREAHRNLCLLKQWLHTELGGTIAVTRENGEPRTDTRCLTKTRIKNRQTAVGQFVSYTIYSRLRGVSFFPVKHRKEVTENTSAAATAPFSPQKRSVKHWSQPYSHGFGSKPRHASLRVISAALTIWVFFLFPFLFFFFLSSVFPPPGGAV